MARAEQVRGRGEAGGGGECRLCWACLARVFLLRLTGSHRKQLSWVGLHVCDLRCHKDPWLGGRGSTGRGQTGRP